SRSVMAQPPRYLAGDFAGLGIERERVAMLDRNPAQNLARRHRRKRFIRAPAQLAQRHSQAPGQGAGANVRPNASLPPLRVDTRARSQVRALGITSDDSVVGQFEFSAAFASRS